MKDEKKKKDKDEVEEIASNPLRSEASAMEEDATSTSNVADANEAELEKIQKQVGDFENKYKRALADYQNLQKRVQDEKGEWIRSANKELILRILTVLDTLILAYQHTQDKNIQVSVQQFLDILKSEGVIKIETVGQKFDPNTMEAIATDVGEEGNVIEELRTGFLLHDKLLRAAQVKVGAKSA